MTNLPHTAISSCSGYIYQGKIAVMHCLRLFEDLGEKARHLKLEIESLDDFAILNAENEYQSMHQVKAKKDSKFSGYKKAIEKQIHDSKSYPNIETYFHVATPIEDIPKNFSEDFKPIQFYIYKDQSENKSLACTLINVDSLNENQAKKAYQALNQNSFKSENEYLKKTRQCLEDLVVKHIIEVHHKIIIERNKGRTDRRIAMESNIPLERFYQLLVNEDLNRICEGEAYFHYQLLKDAGRYFHEYCMSEVDDDCDALVLLKLNSFLNKLNSFEIPDLIKFIQTILPHRIAGFKSLKQYKDNAFNSEDFQYGLLSVFHQLKEAKSRSDLLFYWEKEKVIYVPTAINLSSSSSDRVCVDIVKTALNDDVELLFESGKLINQGIDNDSIFSNIQVGKLSIPEDSDESLTNRINRFKKISLISLENAKVIIND